MGKLKVRLSFKEFSLELEGSREEVPQLGQNLGRQLAGLIAAPAANVVPGAIPPVAVNEHVNGSAERGKKARPRKANSKAETPTKWVYDGQQYGKPSQNWLTTDKAMWVLYVTDKVMGIKRMGAAQITSIFNKHYQEAKTIHRGNVYNGFESSRKAENAPVGKHEDGTFFLTQEGYKQVGKLIGAEKN
jgi:hypothetical protein